MSRLTLAIAIALATSLALVALNPAAARSEKTSHARTAAVYADCGGTIGSCMRAMLGLLNADRSALRLTPVRLSKAQSLGSANCSGSVGHSAAMARSGTIWHINPRFPHASFPNNICTRNGYMAENVGRAASGNVLQDLQTLDRMMMSEPHSRRSCSGTVNHACNIVNAAYTSVGIGIHVDTSSATWLTEDFTG